MYLPSPFVPHAQAMIEKQPEQRDSLRTPVGISTSFRDVDLTNAPCHMSVSIVVDHTQPLTVARQSKTPPSRTPLTTPLNPTVKQNLVTPVKIDKLAPYLQGHPLA
ncbi:hypothetical protein DPMN_098770 [Dreissena polymorpha]|uniref:Uncharacterized protein n=1 Tax=Dreissena polymorpha TaxID=45954 RepID=A0A9D4R713_DREPO|nr:hypothetical protein DPMN_098770 [Dreissena polymorpha]